MRTEHYEMDGDRVAPVRPQPMYKMRADKAAYDAQRPPCQALPWLLSTPGTLFCVKTGGVPVQIVQAQLFEMQKEGVYVNAMKAGSHAANPGTLVWWKSPWSRGPMFELEINLSMVEYKPVWTEPTWQSMMEALPNCNWLSWRRERVVMWYDKRTQDDEF